MADQVKKELTMNNERKNEIIGKKMGWQFYAGRWMDAELQKEMVDLNGTLTPAGAVAVYEKIAPEMNYEEFGAMINATQNPHYGFCNGVRDTAAALWGGKVMRLDELTKEEIADELAKRDRRIEELEAELSKVRSEYQEHVAMVARKERPAYDEQQQIIMRLREALRFYSDRRRYHHQNVSMLGSSSHAVFQHCDISEDSGCIARKALEGGEDV